MTTNVEIGYLEADYMEDDYLLGLINAGVGVELLTLGANGVGVELFAFGLQAEALGVQMITSTLGHVHCDPNEVGYLELPYLEDPYLVDYMCVGVGVELEVATRKGIGVELNVKNYNDLRLRVMCEIPSRGDGTSWTANSTLASTTSSFDVNNVNDDLIENVWRSNNIITGIQLNCDAGAGNSIFVDTIFFLNHNLTSSAAVQMLGSDDPTFTVIGQTLDLTITEDDEFIYIAEEFPLAGFRYWRINIDDNTNSNAFLQFGVIGFGESEVFETDCFILPVEHEETDYVDVMKTEAFTNIMNERARRNAVKLVFKNIVYDSQDHQRFVRIFDFAGVTLKCLWVPTPQFPYRYMTFAKMKKLPRFRDNVISKTGDYVSFTVETDEAL